MEVQRTRPNLRPEAARVPVACVMRIREGHWVIASPRASTRSHLGPSRRDGGPMVDVCGVGSSSVMTSPREVRCCDSNLTRTRSQGSKPVLRRSLSPTSPPEQRSRRSSRADSAPTVRARGYTVTTIDAIAPGRTCRQTVFSRRQQGKLRVQCGPGPQRRHRTSGRQSEWYRALSRNRTAATGCARA